MNDIDSFFHVRPSKIPPSSGKILLAEPLMQDPYFSRSVILIVDNNETGAFGLILNNPTDFSIQDLDPTLVNAKTTIYWGGPVEEGSLFFIHTLGNLIPDSHAVANGIYCGGNWEIIKEMIDDNILNEQNFRLFLGYSGWTEKQLDDEINRKSWVVSQIDSKMIFETPSKELWNASVTKLGNQYVHWMHIPESPEFN